MTDKKEKMQKKEEAARKAREAKKENAVYAAEERAILILDILKKYTDEEHFLSQAELLKIMFRDEYAADPKLASTSSRNTLHKSLKRMIDQMNPVMYDDNDEEYRIKYEAYDRETPPRTLKKLRYVHDFNNEELDQLMHAVNFDNSLSLADKQRLMGKLHSTASRFYKSPYYDRDTERVKFYDYGIYTRLDSRMRNESDGGGTASQSETRNEMAKNIKVIQYAINNRIKIRFLFNAYNREGRLEPRLIDTADGKYTVSPYYIVVYQEFYYLIGAFDNPKKPNIYRIDLMTEVEAVSDDERGKAWPIRKVPGLPTREKWDPERFMREHLYMFYDEPRRVTLRIKEDAYTFIHDWFGDTYTAKRTPSGREGYDLVEVRCTTNAMVHFALQWSERVEVIDEDIRERIREKLKELSVGIYGEKQR